MAIEPLRVFQEEDLPWFLSHLRSLMLYDPRLGKTVEVCNILPRDPEVRKVLISCPKNALFVWRNHLVEWFKHLSPETVLDIRIVRGKGSTAKAQRQALWLKPIMRMESNRVVTVWITTFGSLDRDVEFLQLPSTIKAGVMFDTVIGDEVHLRLRNRKNKAAKYFNWLTHPSRCRRFHPLSGTMGSKGGPLDFWALLHMCNPKEFPSYWKFAAAFVNMVKNPWGGVELLEPKNIDAFYRLLDRYARRRFRHIVAPHMPKVQRALKPVEPTDEQLRIYQELNTDSISWVGDDLIVTSTSLERNLRIRQLLVCPKLLNPELGYGAAIEDLIDYLTDADNDLTPEDKHLVVFTPFSEALQYFQQALKEAGYANVWKLYGGMDPEEQAENIELFQKTKGIILCSIKYAQAFSLCPAQQCYFIGYEYDPQDNKQAEDRLVPQTGHNPINAWYYAYQGIDDTQAEIVNLKNKLITLTIGSHTK